MKNIAIIPARSGSKGIHDKNIKLIAGVPAMAYTIKAALDSGMFDTVMVSTDSEKYAEIAMKYGAEVPFLRSAETSTDMSSSWSVVREVISRYEEIGRHFDTLALLQVTSPLRTGNDIVKAFGELEDKNANAIISMCETETPIEYCNVLPEDLSLVGFYDDSKYRPRQTRKTTYHANGAIYLYKIDAFHCQKTIYDEKCYAFLMDRIHSVDIDELDDFLMVEALIQYIDEFNCYFSIEQ